ncbi:MAG: glycoside hydrolase family 3 N-terminal domain-containing protein, partial [Chloroflexota bacterium]
MRSALGADAYAGVTLFRHWNVASVGQLRELTGALQAAARTGPLLIATDQEGGQLNALGEGPTPFAGAMALGAVADEDLAERVAAATGRELRALGVNVDYAPVCDLATNPANPALGIRCFGDDAQAVGRLAAATVRGLQSEGVAATVKHFPGLGDAPVDTHHELAVVSTSRDVLESRELVPFRAAIAAGARLAMAGHIAVPALTGSAAVPASLSPAALRDVLRDEL